MIRIAVVDDHAVVRAGLRHLLADQSDLSVVAEAGNGREAIDLLREHAIDVMLLDMSMPGFDGADAMLAVKARRPGLPVLIFSGMAREAQAVSLLQRGASGYISKDAEPLELLRAIRQVYRGHRYMPVDVADRLAQAWAAPSSAPCHALLSHREMQVFLHLARGETVGEVARLTCLSAKTVSTYRSRLLVKLALGNNCDLTYYALKHGLIH